MDWWEYFSAIFYDSTSPAFFSAEFARELVVAFVIFLIGWAASLRSSRKRMRQRAIDDLILAQKELHSRAFPEDWSQNGRREEWMLAPFVDRVSSVVRNLVEEDLLKDPEKRIIEHYPFALQAFVQQWAVTINRGQRYHSKYNQTYLILQQFVELAASRQVSRLNGLIQNLEHGPEIFVAAE